MKPLVLQQRHRGIKLTITTTEIRLKVPPVVPTEVDKIVEFARYVEKTMEPSEVTMRGNIGIKDGFYSVTLWNVSATKKETLCTKIL